MALFVWPSSRKTRVVESDLSLPNSDSSVQTDAEMTPDQQKFLAKTLESPNLDDHFMSPREKDEVHQQGEFCKNRKGVVPIEEDTSVDSDSDSDTNFHKIRHDTKRVEFKPLNCQPSEAGKQQSSTLAIPPTSSSCKLEPFKGNWSHGTKVSLPYSLQEYTSSPEEFQFEAHAIVTSRSKRPTDFDKYNEVTTGPGYQYIRDVGKGSFGCVKMYKDNTMQKDFAIKEISREDNTFHLEAKLHSELHHPNITEVYGSVFRNGKLKIFMEYAGVSLKEYTMHPDSEEDLHETKIIEILYQALSGLEYLDSKKIIHYDIKPENFRLRKCAGYLSLKICVFGSAKDDFRGSTIEYLSPELAINLTITHTKNRTPLPIDKSNYIMTTKSDIFSLALTVMYIYRKGHVVISLFNNGNLTYDGLDADQIRRIQRSIIFNVGHALIDKKPSWVQVLIPDDCCSEMKSILKDMVKEFPHNRPSATQLKATIDDLLKRNTMNTYTAASAQNVGYQGAVRNALPKKRKVSRDRGSFPYGIYVQRIDSSDINATDELKAMLPKFSSFTSFNN